MVVGERTGYAAAEPGHLAFLENELGLRCALLWRLRPAQRGRFHSGIDQRSRHLAGRPEPRRRELRGDFHRAPHAWNGLLGASPERAYLAFDRLERAVEQRGAAAAFRGALRRHRRQSADWRARWRRPPPRRARPHAEAFELLLDALEHNPHGLTVHQAIWNVLSQLDLPRCRALHRDRRDVGVLPRSARLPHAATAARSCSGSARTATSGTRSSRSGSRPAKERDRREAAVRTSAESLFRSSSRSARRPARRFPRGCRRCGSRSSRVSTFSSIGNCAASRRSASSRDSPSRAMTRSTCSSACAGHHDTASNSRLRPVSNSSGMSATRERRRRRQRWRRTRQSRRRPPDGRSLRDRAARACHENDFAEPGAIERAVGARGSRPNRSRPRRARRSGRDRLAREHVGIDDGHTGARATGGAHALAGRDAAGQRNLRGHIAADFGRCADDRCRRRGEGVSQHHRDRQRPDAARHRRQRAGHLGDLGMHVADEDAALLRECRAACGCPRAKKRSTSPRSSPRSCRRRSPSRPA